MSTTESINFTRGVPANESFPLDELRDAATSVIKEHGPAILQYGPAAGFAPFREWIAGWQDVQPAQVLVGNGSLELVEFLCRHLIRPGDSVFTESPTYDRSILVFRRHGAEVTGIPLDSDGPDVDALEAALRKRVPRFFYVIADFQNPSGATCSGPKRQRIAELARRYDFVILEDAPYRLLRYRGNEEPTLFSGSGTHITYELIHKAHRSGNSRGFHAGGRRAHRSNRACR
jgi:DNA-binding transcriptional MocR family regulator